MPRRTPRPGVKAPSKSASSAALAKGKDAADVQGQREERKKELKKRALMISYSE
jgi:hypothetical protein